MAEYTVEEMKKIKEAIERLEPDFQREIYDALRDGAELIWDGDDIVGLMFGREEVASG